MKWDQIQLSRIFQNVPAIIPGMNWKFNHSCWESPLYPGGIESRRNRPDVTVVKPGNDGIMIYFNSGVSDPMGIEKYLMEHHGFTSFKAACDYIRDHIGEERPARKEKRHIKMPESQHRKPIKDFDPTCGGKAYQVAEDAYSGSTGANKKPVRGPVNPRMMEHGHVGYQYLMTRRLGVPIWDKDIMGCIGSGEYPGSEKGRDGLMVRWCSLDGNKAGLYHYSPLADEDGNLTGKADKRWLPGNGPRNMDATGGAVRLSPMSGDTLGLCEGVEDALAVMTMNGRLTSAYSPNEACKIYGLPEHLADIPVWSVLSSSNMKSFMPPEGCKKVVIFGDPDKAGTSKALELSDKLHVMGIEVERYYPHGLGDFNDMLPIAETRRNEILGVVEDE